MDSSEDERMTDENDNDGLRRRKYEAAGSSDPGSSFTDPGPSTSKASTSSFLPNRTKSEMEKLLEDLSKRTEGSGGSTTTGARGPSPFTWNFPRPEEQSKKNYANSEEYFRDLRLWVQQACFWQTVTAAFPYFFICQQLGGQQAQGQATGVPFPFPFSPPPFQAQEATQPPPPTEVIDGVECRIPSFWKRIAAEFIDFLLLLVVKIAVSYVAVDFFNLVEMDTFDLFQKDVTIAYKTFVQITQDIVILEIIHRLFVCAFETFWLSGGERGGATPGKNIMGLRVIVCENSTAMADRSERVVVRPGQPLSIGTAFLRALTKNFVIALLIPTSFAFIFFPHNRTGYDMICGTIVVEDPVVPHRVVVPRPQ